MKTIEDWKDDFYPVEADSPEALKSVGTALRHSIRKWSGLDSKTLEKYGLHKESDDNKIYSKDSLSSEFTVDSFSCALCSWCNVDCDTCVGAIANGYYCDQINPHTNVDPFLEFVRYGSTKPMLDWLQEAEDYLGDKSDEKTRQ